MSLLRCRGCCFVLVALSQLRKLLLWLAFPLQLCTQLTNFDRPNWEACFPRIGATDMGTAMQQSHYRGDEKSE